MSSTTDLSHPGYPTVDFNNRRSPQPAGTYFRVYDKFRDLAPVVRSNADQGWWILTAGDAIRRALQDPKVFSNSAVVVNEPEPVYRLIPDMLDPPEHTVFRQLLAPHFSPRAVARLKPAIRRRCVELIDGLYERGECDFVEDFARLFPTSIFMELMGLPVSESARFMAWEDKILRAATNDPRYDELRRTGVEEVTDYFAHLLSARRREPRDDLVTFLTLATIDGRPVSQEDLLSTCLLLFMAGLDTVAMQLCWSLFYLATHDEDRHRVAANPALIPTATEELLRVFAFVAPGRKVQRDVDFYGCQLRAGDMVLLPLSCATRDPALFDRADEVDLGRQVNPHIAFGAGPHRCLGSNLARQELCVAMEEWHGRVPDYRVAGGGVGLTEHGGMVGLDFLPLEWTPAHAD